MQDDLFRFEDARQKRIHRGLLLVGAGPAAFFVDACRIVASQPPLQTASHLVAHALREIESALRDVLGAVSEPVVETGREECNANHKLGIRAILRDLGIPETDSVAVAWLGLTGYSDTSLNKLAHRRALGEPRSMNDEIFHRFWEDMLRILDYVLERFESLYAVYFKKIDRIVAGRVLAQLKTVPQNPTTDGYFFRKIEADPWWLKPLLSRGFFGHPTPPLRTDTGVAYPEWPQNRYLKAVAEYPETAEDVLEIVLGISTDNPRVCEELLEVGLAVPVDLAARLLPKAKEWLALSDPFFVPIKVGALAAYLGEGGKSEEAMELVRSLLALSPPSEIDVQGRSRLLTNGPKPHFAEYEYQEILTDYVPRLVDAVGFPVFGLLCETLEMWVCFSRAQDGGPGDLSRIWRATVAPFPDDPLGHEIEQLLVSGVRDAAERMVRGGEALDEVALFLLDRPYRIFHRVALHLLTQFAELPATVREKCLTERAYFDDPDMYHEYSILLERSFGPLSASDQKTILGWVDAGPSRDAPVFLKEGADGQEDPATAVRWRNIWERDQLARFGTSLPPNWKKRLEALTAEIGPPTVIKLSRWTEHTGPVSPIAADDILQLPADEVVKFLHGWEPTDPSDWDEPSSEGLGRALESAVQAKPAEYALVASAFLGLDPVYIEALLSGLERAINEQETLFLWPPVLELCQWVVDQPRAIPGYRPWYADLNPGWVWARKRIAALLRAGFQSKPSRIPREFRKQVWALVFVLAQDEDPTAEDEVRDAGQFDPITQSMNTVRGQAMHATIECASWEQSAIAEAGGAVVPRRLSDEAREILNLLLDPEEEQSAAVRSVYGMNFARLLELDQNWVGEQIEQIFPSEPAQGRLRDVAWEAFVTSTAAHPRLLEILGPQYGWAVGSIGQRSDARWPFGEPDKRLAEHLLLYYLHGCIERAEDDLLSAFFERAPVELRAYMLGFAGRALARLQGDKWEEGWPPLCALWQWRSNEVLRGPRGPALLEVSEYGWWFIERRIARDWALAQLREMLQAGVVVEPSQKVMEAMALDAADSLEQVMSCLELLLRIVNTPWVIRSWRKEVRDILGLARAHETESVRRKAGELVSLLAAGGSTEFLDLLPDRIQT